MINEQRREETNRQHNEFSMKIQNSLCRAMMGEYNSMRRHRMTTISEGVVADSR